MSWTDERVELLKKMWTEGQSASQIAKELGGVTRNAVIGKVHRLGLSNRVGGKDEDEGPWRRWQRPRRKDPRHRCGPRPWQRRPRGPRAAVRPRRSRARQHRQLRRRRRQPRRCRRT